MAAMVARGDNQLQSSVSHQENGHRNKRKFRSEPPSVDPNKLGQSLADISSNYGFPVEFSAEQLPANSPCDLCSSLSCPVDDETVAHKISDADWNIPTEAQLKELLLSNLDAKFNSAIARVVSEGYAEDAARRAILKFGLSYGIKDTISNIVDKALAFIASVPVADTLRQQSFEDLRQLEEYLLSEMICILKGLRPSFSTGDAMWCLLIFDMNLTHASTVEGDSLSGSGSDGPTLSSSLSQIRLESNVNNVASNKSLELNSGKPHKPNAFSLYSQPCVQNDLPLVTGIPNLPPVKFSSSNSSNATSTNTTTTTTTTTTTIDPSPAKENTPSLVDCVSNAPSLVDCVIQGFSSTGASETQAPAERFMNGKRCNGVGISKRDSILRQKSIYSDRGCRAHRSKGSLRSGKPSNFGGTFDRRSRPCSDSTGLNLKASMLKKSKPLGLDSLQGVETSSLSFSAGSSDRLPLTPTTDNGFSHLSTANTELSLSLPSKSNTNGSSSETSNIFSGRSDSPSYFNCNESPSNMWNMQWALHESKDDMLNKLLPRVSELQTQLQEWSEWAQQKVMQAARRLNKDKVELQTLRQEKEEISRLKKEKLTLEENTTKKLSEMESALSKASLQVEKANSAICRLEVENAHLRQQMETAKLRAANSAANCQEASKREVATVKTFQYRDRQKAQLHEEFLVEKQKLSHLQQQYSQDKAFLDQLESRLKQEETMRDDSFMLLQHERREREQMEISTKSKEDALKLKAENDLLLYKDEMRKLEHQISQLRLKSDSSKIAALWQGLHSSYASRVASGLSSSAKDSRSHSPQIVQEYGEEDIQRERECVMCLTEEMSVVFLPCAHQVVCGTCNKLHEQQGMKDCPSCRTTINQRITVRSSRS